MTFLTPKRKLFRRDYEEPRSNRFGNLHTRKDTTEMIDGTQELPALGKVIIETELSRRAEEQKPALPLKDVARMSYTTVSLNVYLPARCGFEEMFRHGAKSQWKLDPAGLGPDCLIITGIDHRASREGGHLRGVNYTTNGDRIRFMFRNAHKKIKHFGAVDCHIEIVKESNQIIVVLPPKADRPQYHAKTRLRGLKTAVARSPKLSGPIVTLDDVRGAIATINSFINSEDGNNLKLSINEFNHLKASYQVNIG